MKLHYYPELATPTVMAGQGSPPRYAAGCPVTRPSTS